MNTPNQNPVIESAGWNEVLADELLAKADEWYVTSRLARAADAHIKAEPQAANDESFLSFLARAHEVYLERGDYKEAHGYGVRFYHLDREDLGAPLISQSGYLLAHEEFAKASAALKEKDYRRASDKGVWAATHFGDAIRAGRLEAGDEFYAAAGVTFEANAYYGGLTDTIEKPIFADCDELGIPRPVELLMAIRVRAYEEAYQQAGTYQASIMLRHAKALKEFGAPVIGMARRAAVLGIKAYMAGEGSFFPEEFIEALSDQKFPEEELAKIKLSAMQRQYDLDFYSAMYNNPDQDVAAYKWFAVAVDCVELIKLGDEAAKDNLLTALEEQVGAIDEYYFTRADEYGINIHFDRYVEAKLIPEEKGIELKLALRKKLLTIRSEYLEEPYYEDDEWSQAAIRRIDLTIQDFT